MNGILGHDSQIAAFRAAMGQGRMHHAWLLAGPEGVGKARFAEMAALRYLAEGMAPVDLPDLDLPDDHPAVALANAGSHPDYQRLSRLFREKTGDLARNITVDQVRGLQGLFATTATFSSRRAVVIDSIDDLERNAANALLKNLEEPPADTLFLLVSHSPGRLLPTIRSRCRLLRFGRLDDDVMAALLGRELPESKEAEISALVRVGAGAPGQALRFADLDIAGLDSAMERLARDGDPTNAARCALARHLSLKSAQPRYEAFLDRAPSVIAAHARDARGQAMADAIELWERARSIAGSAVHTSMDPQTTVFVLAGLIAALAPGETRAKA